VPCAAPAPAAAVTVSFAKGAAAAAAEKGAVPEAPVGFAMFLQPIKEETGVLETS
jgi:hypothetical protein